MEKTLVIFKPSALQRGLVGEILSRFEKKGLKIVALKMYRMSKEKCAEHYAHTVDKPFYPNLEASMTGCPLIVCCLEGVDAIMVARGMTGATNARKAVPGTIRGDYGMSAQENIIHASDSPENAEIELNRFFNKEDYFEYPLAAQCWMYSPDDLA